MELKKLNLTLQKGKRTLELIIKFYVLLGLFSLLVGEERELGLRELAFYPWRTSKLIIRQQAHTKTNDTLDSDISLLFRSFFFRGAGRVAPLQALISLK